ncbi:6246_t:CDS:1 [Paraglomus brasilianum]|uniref:6246_t:CDS:1 n=1 Tax=Paraglomus brasilianum TaxID=144538 RepID=A0A9N9G0A9_9GLOM|nr:6246_t:CDS:1 [Paraglomus brasilianum]
MSYHDPAQEEIPIELSHGRWNESEEVLARNPRYNVSVIRFYFASSAENLLTIFSVIEIIRGDVWKNPAFGVCEVSKRREIFWQLKLKIEFARIISIFTCRCSARSRNIVFWFGPGPPSEHTSSEECWRSPDLCDEGRRLYKQLFCHGYISRRNPPVFEDKGGVFGTVLSFISDGGRFPSAKSRYEAP